MADFQPRADGDARQVNIAGDNFAPIFVDGRLPLPTTFRGSSYYTSTIDAFRDHHADADWGETVHELLTAFTAAPGFHVVTGEAYAGKTALMTKLHEELEHRGIATVIFYVVQHEADRPAHYLPAVITQLLEALTDREPSYVTEELEQTLERQLVQYEKLWRAFAAGPDPVFLLLDGLDERATEPGEAGLAGLIPRSTGTHGRIVLTTRPNPELDLPRAHPLTRQLDDATHLLSPSPSVRVRRGLVERELATFLRSNDPAARDLASLIAVAGAPVSDRELAELLHLPSPGATPALRAPIARSLFVEYAPDGTPRFRFAHQAIRVFAEDELDRDGAGGTDVAIGRILVWARRYATTGWPLSTPRFLAEHLPTFIASRVEPGLRGPWLTALLHDDYRRLTRQVASNDRVFLQLLALTRDAVTADMDVGADQFPAFLVEAWSTEIAAFNPTPLYPVTALARAGLHDRALDAVRLIPDPAQRCLGFSLLVRVMQRQGASDAARIAQCEMATAFSELELDIDRHHVVLEELLRSALVVGDAATVWSLLEAAGPAGRRHLAESGMTGIQGPVSVDLAAEFSRAELGQVAAAEFLRSQALLHQSAGSAEQDVASLLAALPEGAAPSVDAQLRAMRDTAAGAPVESCLALFEELSPAERARELATFALFLADSDIGRAVVVARAAEAVVATLSPHDRAHWEATAAAGFVYARAGLLDDAAEMASELATCRDTDARRDAPRIYEEIACSLTRLGRIDEACDLLDRAVPNRTERLAPIAHTAAEMGQLPAALAILEEMAPEVRELAYTGIVDGLCRAGDYDRARDLALKMALEVSTESDPAWRWGVYGALGDVLTAIGRSDLAQRAVDHIPARPDRDELVADLDATVETPPASDDAFADAWAAARDGDFDRCTAIIREATTPSLKYQLAAVGAFCLYRLERFEEASVWLDIIVTDSREDAAAAAMMMAEAYHADPDVTAYRSCAHHLAKALAASHPSITRQRHADEMVLAHSSLLLIGDFESVLTRLDDEDELPLLGLALRRACRTITAARPDDPKLSDLVSIAMAHLPDYQPPPRSHVSGDFYLAELAEIMARAGRMEDALRLATAVSDPKWRARALAPAMLLLPADHRHHRLWRIANRFDDPLNRLRVVARAVATALPPAEADYRRSVRRMFEETRAIDDMHERWEGLGHLALALLPVSPECLDHYLARRVS